MKKKIGLLFLALGTSVIVAGCGAPLQPPFSISITGDNVATVNGAAELKAEMSKVAEVRWTATGGQFDFASGDTVIWKAPDTPGTYSVVATANSKSVTARITVKEPPVEIVGWTLTPDFIGGKEANITVKNNSSKTVNAVKVKMAMWNNFGERICYLTYPIYNGIAPDINVPSGTSDSFTWSLYWANDVTKILPWVYQVAYTDGSTWELK